MGERAVEELFATGIEDRILPVGAMAPDFALKDSSGKSSVPPISSLLARWSSNFSAAAGALLRHRTRGLARPLRQLRERGALMVAIAPQTERQSDFMAGQHGLPFPVLTDPG